MIDWSDFVVFLAVARARTLSGAARSLKVDQSTVSRRLATLEAAAGARLFDRTPEGYLLSAAGEAVHGQVEELEARAIAVERQLLGRDATPSGPVRLAASDSLAVWFLVPQLAVLHARHPGIKVELVTGNQSVNLARREADISLRLTKPKEPNLVARRLGEAAWAVYGSTAYLARHGKPTARGRLRGHRVIGFDPELAGTVGARWLAEHGALGSTVLSCNSLLSQAAAVVAGLGLSALPCVCGDANPALERALPRVIGHHDLWLVVHPDVKNSARVRAVMDYLTELVTAEASLLGGKLKRRRS
ncbi:MAG: LysR family transcriptional regulator [Myxococcales bacterium]|nr:MAG: LysR family transcriptional regulator [Myxococcales bacterium]